MYEAVVFDMDGVIFDTEVLYRKFEFERGAEYGLDEELMAKVCDAIAGGNKFTNKPKFEALVGRGIDYFEWREGMIEAFDAYVKENGVVLKDGVVETLELLKSKGIKIGLATSTAQDRAMNYFGKSEIAKYFDAMVFGDQLKNGKPAPDIYLMACEKLGVDPAKSIGVEDSINGIKSTHAAGMTAVMVIDLIQPTEEVKEIADHIYENMREMHELLA